MNWFGGDSVQLQKKQKKQKNEEVMVRVEK
jgi:hypothetical protein